jgi:flagellar biosynthetic protein FliR
MPWQPFDILLALPVFALVLFRVSGLMLTAPIYRSAVIPKRVRVALAMLLAVLIFPFVKTQAPAEMSMSVALAGGVGEMMIGATIGLSLTILFVALEVGGLIVGRQAGIVLANVYDPARDEEASIIGQVYTISFTVLFLLAGGHRAATAAVLDTYEVIPLLSFRLEGKFVVLLVEMLAAAFALGVRLAGPVLVALFLMGTALAFLSRTMPQLNILTVGFTLRLLVGLAVAAMALSVCDDVLLDAVWDCVALIRSTFGLDPSHTHLVG